MLRFRRRKETDLLADDVESPEKGEWSRKVREKKKRN